MRRLENNRACDDRQFDKLKELRDEVIETLTNNNKRDSVKIHNSLSADMRVSASAYNDLTKTYSMKYLSMLVPEKIHYLITTQRGTKQKKEFVQTTLDIIRGIYQKIAQKMKIFTANNVNHRLIHLKKQRRECSR